MKKNEEIINRRKFFKKTANIIIPTIALSIFPSILSSCEIEEEEIDITGCKGTCSTKCGNNCSSGCKSTCSGMCTRNCATTCKSQALQIPNNCNYSCKNQCYTSCRNTCQHSSK